ncbi:MAG: isochorismatase family cysteine hydrolase [Roseicyclus sp.]|uniref:cysteine hydrolase family protein n=1 Tax=Roseicyclus sp. TaxID=1914329 RepID=UPI003BB11C39
MEPEILADLAARIDPSHCAMLIIDMQKDFCTAGFKAERAGRDLSMAQAAIPRIARLLEGARAAGALIVHVGFGTEPDHGSDSGPWLAQRRRATFSADDLCLTGTEGAEFVDELAPRRGELSVRKRRYSAFTGTDLDLLLRAQRIRSIICCGVSTNACVETTARAGFELDYYIVVPPDACGSWDRELHEGTLRNINHRFGLTPGIDEVLAVWAGKSTKQEAAQ